MVSHVGILIFKFMYNCRRNGSDPERSGIVPWPVQSPKGLDAHVSKSGEIFGQKGRNLYFLSPIPPQFPPFFFIFCSFPKFGEMENIGGEMVISSAKAFDWITVSFFLNQ